MPEQTEPIVVDTTKLSTGKISFFGNVRNPTPTILARVTKALRYFAVSLMATVGATDIFSGGQVKQIVFGLSVFILALGAVDIVVGVEPEKKD